MKQLIEINPTYTLLSSTDFLSLFRSRSNSKKDCPIPRVGLRSRPFLPSLIPLCQGQSAEHAAIPSPRMYFINRCISILIAVCLLSLPSPSLAAFSLSSLLPDFLSASPTHPTKTGPSDAPGPKTRFPPPHPTDYSHAHTDDLYVIATIFNPAGYNSRYKLYHDFAEQFSHHPHAILITVECIYPSMGQHTYSLTQADNPHHVQVVSNSVIWSKEECIKPDADIDIDGIATSNMINYAIRRLPSTARYVAWVDADINFHDPDWVLRAIEGLNKYAVVQMFSHAYFLGPEGQVLITHQGIGYSYTLGVDSADAMHPGYGWAMRRETFLAMGGLPDFHIVGNADQDVAFSYFNMTQYISQRDVHPAYRQCMFDKQALVHRVVLETKAKYHLQDVLGYAAMNVSHNWHGAWQDRGYERRKAMLVASQYNPTTDLTGYNSSHPCPGNPEDVGLKLQQFVTTLSNKDKKQRDALDAKYAEEKKKKEAAKATTPVKAKPPAASASAAAAASTSGGGAASTDRQSMFHLLRIRHLQRDLVDYFTSRKEENTNEVDLAGTGKMNSLVDEL